MKKLPFLSPWTVISKIHDFTVHKSTELSSSIYLPNVNDIKHILTQTQFNSWPKSLNLKTENKVYLCNHEKSLLNCSDEITIIRLTCLRAPKPRCQFYNSEPTLNTSSSSVPTSIYQHSRK